MSWISVGTLINFAVILKSPELSGITWFNLSAVQLGLLWFPLWSSSSFSHWLSPGGFPWKEERTYHCIPLVFKWWFVDCVCSWPWSSFDSSASVWSWYWHGNAWGASLHSRNLSISNSGNFDISKGAFHSSRDIVCLLSNPTTFPIFIFLNATIHIQACFLMQLGYFIWSFEIDAVGGWRYMYGFGAPVACIMGLGMLSLPPSPRWLLLKAIQGKGTLITRIQREGYPCVEKTKRGISWWQSIWETNRGYAPL